MVARGSFQCTKKIPLTTKIISTTTILSNNHPITDADIKKEKLVHRLRAKLAKKNQL